MTTLEEISACPVKNREFWTAYARLALILMREHRDIPAERRLQRHGFLKSMRSRRAQKYLTPPEPPLSDQQVEAQDSMFQIPREAP
jgi:hypothetical protein